MAAKPKHIDKLEIGESKTIWIGITGDCTINVDYVADKQRTEENVAGYVTNNMGQKMKYKIGGHNEKNILTGRPSSRQTNPSIFYFLFTR